ncbi:MAG: hypothetical protein SGI86_13130 [Deltaproteobacteria bacterium]|nr:hypothetical protein [Deltaproteobacteria bacterium]
MFAAIRPLMLLSLVALATAACGTKIGDGCTVNIDCSINGDRVCDTAQPGGYCTVDACDENSCPDDGVCVRVFAQMFVSRMCDPAQEDLMKDDCSPEELCLPSGRCVPRVTERRYCAAACSNGGDCRGSYECRVLGTEGSVAVVSSQQNKAKFCAPKTL